MKFLDELFQINLYEIYMKFISKTFLKELF